MAKLKITNSEMESLKNMNGKEYKHFLISKIEECKKSPYHRRFSCIKNNELEKYLKTQPLNEEEVKYKETKDQRNERLKLAKNFRKNRYIDMEVNVHKKNIDEIENFITFKQIENLLSITRKTLSVIINKNKYLKIYNQGKIKGINKKEILSFINKHHYTGTKLGFDIFEKKVKDIKDSPEQLGDYLNSKEVIEMANRYLKEVLEENRVNKNDTHSEVLDIIKSNKNNIIVSIYEKYNPKIKIVEEKETELEQLYPIKKLTSIIQVSERTMLRYCEDGQISYYKFSKNKMVSQKDIDNNLLLISNKKTASIKRNNCGRKTKLETLFSDIDIIKLNKNDYFKKIAPSEFNQYIKIYMLLKEKNMKDSTRKGLISKEISYKRKLIKKSIIENQQKLKIDENLLNFYIECKNLHNKNKNLIKKASSYNKETSDILKKKDADLIIQIKKIREDILKNRV